MEEAMKPSKVIFMTDVPESILDRRVIRQHFSAFGTVRRVSIDKESACCSICFTSVEAAQKAFLEGTNIDNYKLKIMLGTSSGPSLNEKTEPLRDTHTYDDLDMNYLDDSNDIFRYEEPSNIDDSQSEKDLFKLKKKIIRELHKEKSASPKEPVKNARKVSTSGEQVRTVKRTVAKGSKLLKKTSATTMTSEELSKVMSLKKKYEILDLRDKLYREKLKAKKLNLNVGTCPDMCPEKERIMRAYRKLWTSYELQPGSNRLHPELAVKEYSRSSANQEEPLPHDLRPEPVLNMTMNYLVLNIMPTIEKADVNVSQWFDFLWDRLRGIRKDIVQQQLCSVNTAHIIEQCARFHILCFDRLFGEDAAIFDEKMNTENLNNCLQSLIHMYDDLSDQGLQCPNEPEFRAYAILLKLDLGDINWEFQQLSPHLQTAPEILFALHVFSAFSNNVYSQFFKLVKQTTYLNACLLQRYFSFVRSRALLSIISNFSKPPSKTPFKNFLRYLKDFLKFESDNDVLEFCSAHGMFPNEDGDMFIENIDIPSNVSSCQTTSHNMIKDKRMELPVTITGPAGVPQEIHHKVHSSFDADGNLNKLAANAIDQIKKLEEDFGYIVSNVPIIDIEENILTEYEKLDHSKQSKDEKKSSVDSKVFGRLGSPVQKTSTSKEVSNTSNEIFKTNPFKKDVFKVNPFQKEAGPSSSNLFRTIDNASQENSFGEKKLYENSNLDTNIFKQGDTDADLFKKPFAPKQFSNTSANVNTFTKPSPDFLETSPPKENIFKIPSKTNNAPTLFSKSIISDGNLFQKPTSDSNVFAKQSNENNIFQKAILNSNQGSFLAPSIFKKGELDSSSGLFTKTQPSQVRSNIFGGSLDSANSVSNANTLFNRPSSFSEFMKPSSSAISESKKDDSVHNSSFNFLEKVSEIKDTSRPTDSLGKNSGFEKSFELFVKESEQQSRKRVADEEREIERQKEFEKLEREKMKQHLIELEQHKQKQLEMEKEMEIQRQLMFIQETKRQQDIELQKQKELEEKMQKELEEKRQKELELERLRQIEWEKQKEWEMKVKQDIINKKVEYDFQIAMNKLAKAQRKKTKEHELLMNRLRKEKELKMLRKVVKKKIKYIHAKKCAKKWKDRVKRLQINKLEFPQVVLNSVENHTAVWGSVKHIRNHAPYRMTDRYAVIEQLNKNPPPSSDNVYLGQELTRVLKQQLVRPRFIKQNCQFTTPFVWKVGFHLPHLPLEYTPVEAQLTQFLRKLCYDSQHELGECGILRVNGHTLHTSYHLAQGDAGKMSGLLGSDLFVFIMSKLWETLEESCARFQACIGELHADVPALVLVYRSSYSEQEVVDCFNTSAVSVIRWSSAADVSRALVSLFSSHFSPHQPQLCYDNLYDFLSNEVEAVFMQVKLDLDMVVCADEMLAQFRKPNYFISIYNTLVSKLYLVVEPISLASEFHPVLFKHKASTLLNTPHQLECLVNQLTLPTFKTWPVLKTSKLKKLLKHFCAVIDKSGRSELYATVMRLLNPPQDNLESYLSRVNWSDILLPCFLWNLRAHASHMNSAFLFYDRNNVKSELHSHWWVSMSSAIQI